jgi:hypothetical protein
MHRIAAVAVLLLCGCASSTGILPAGPETYTITERLAPIRGGGDAAQADALTKADQFCAEKGRQFVPALMGNPVGPPNTGYTVTFKCLPANDPAVANFRPQQAPNVIVERRNR